MFTGREVLVWAEVQFIGALSLYPVLRIGRIPQAGLQIAKKALKGL
jgi:hypothetical protein